MHSGWDRNYPLSKSEADCTRRLHPATSANGLLVFSPLGASSTVFKTLVQRGRQGWLIRLHMRSVSLTKTHMRAILFVTEANRNSPELL
jgi:hypothetical protein